MTDGHLEKEKIMLLFDIYHPEQKWLDRAIPLPREGSGVIYPTGTIARCTNGPELIYYWTGTTWEDDDDGDDDETE